MKIVGLFRLAGSQEKIQDLQKQFDMAKDPDLTKIDDPHTISGLLKLYFRMMSDPLLTWELYESYISTTGITLFIFIIYFII